MENVGFIHAKKKKKGEQKHLQVKTMVWYQIEKFLVKKLLNIIRHHLLFINNNAKCYYLNTLLK